MSGGPGTGTYSFDNRADIHYSGVEQTIADATAPMITSQAYSEIPGSTIAIVFSEDVSNALTVDYLNLVDLATGAQVPYYARDLAYDASTNTATFTFPGLPGGKLPAGDYRASIFSTLGDAFGNLLGVEIPFDFSVQDDVIDGDFNDDGLFDCADIDMLVADIVAGNHSPQFDLNGDSLVDLSDRDAWLAEAAAVNGLASPYRLGDANLDGVVDGQDFIVWNSNKFTSAAGWCAGDFNADGFVDGQDFIAWNGNKFTSSNLLAGVAVRANDYDRRISHVDHIFRDGFEAVGGPDRWGI